MALMHVDEFIDSHKSDAYARWMFMHFRLPAEMMLQFQQFMWEHKLFCTYDGKRYRVTGASRLGDVWLHSNFNEDTTYQHRVEVDECSEWAKEP
jgi:hypothetical protein